MAAPGLNCDMWDLLAACELLVAACRIFVPRPGIKPGTLALRAGSLSPWTTREVLPSPCSWGACVLVCHCLLEGSVVMRKFRSAQPAP